METRLRTLAKYNNIRKANPDTMLNTYDLVWHDPRSKSRLTTIGVWLTVLQRLISTTSRLLFDRQQLITITGLRSSHSLRERLYNHSLMGRIAVPEIS